MTGPEHYTEAERLLGLATDEVSSHIAAGAGFTLDDFIAAAQVHATLALAAATAMGTLPLELAPRDVDAWDVVT